MEKNITHEAYVKANIRLEELINQVDDTTPETDPLAIELMEVSDIIEEYEEKYHAIGLPSLNEVIELRMFEMKLKKKVVDLINFRFQFQRLVLIVPPILHVRTG